MTFKVWRIGVATNALFAQQVYKKRAGLVALLREVGLVVLVLLHVLHVLVEEVGGVKRAALGFGMELGTEDGT